MCKGGDRVFGCNRTVTVTHLEYNGSADRDERIEQTFAGCSWYGQTKAAATDAGLQSAGVYKCRIPAQAAGGQPPAIACGDEIACGDMSATVVAVHDNTDRPQAPHWYVEAQG